MMVQKQQVIFPAQFMLKIKAYAYAWLMVLVIGIEDYLLTRAVAIVFTVQVLPSNLLLLP